MSGNLIPSKTEFKCFLKIPLENKQRVIFGLGTISIVAILLAIGLYLNPEITVFSLVAIGIGIPLLVLLWLRPDLGLLALVFLATSLIRSDIVDLRLPIGGGFELRDLALLVMLGLLILRGLIHNNLVLPCWSVSAPLIIFLALALLSTIYALFFQHVGANWVFSELRAIIFYSLFFVTAWSITNEQQLRTVLISLFVIANIIVGVLVLQQFLGGNQFILSAMKYSNWRLYDMEDIGGSASFGMIRVMPPGIVLVYFMAITAVCLMALSKQKSNLRTILALQFVFLSLGLLLTYTRALWIAIICSIGLILLVLYPTYKNGLARYLITGFAVVLLFVSLWANLGMQNLENSDVVTTYAKRVLSILSPEETLESDSLQWRVFENGSAIRSILEHPLLGVGLGNSYRTLTVLQGEAQGYRTEGMDITRMSRFIHCSYLYIGVKMGLLALFCFFWFCGALLYRSWHLFRNLSWDLSRALVLAVLVSLVGLMLWSILHQHFMSTESTAVVGLMAGLVATTQRVKIREGVEK